MAKFTIEFSEKADRDLKGLIKALGVKSKAEVVRKAVNLLRYVVQEQQEGSRLVLENQRDRSRKEVITI